MAVHLFGNVSSPSIATFGLRKTAEEEEMEFGSVAKNFVYNDFYVDDGLTSQPYFLAFVTNLMVDKTLQVELNVEVALGDFIFHCRVK